MPGHWLWEVETEVCQEVGFRKVGESGGSVCHAVFLTGNVADGIVNTEVYS